MSSKIYSTFALLIVKQALIFYLRSVLNRIYESRRMEFLLDIPILPNILECGPHKLMKSSLQASQSFTQQMKELNYLLDIPYHPQKSIFES